MNIISGVSQQSMEVLVVAALASPFGRLVAVAVAESGAPDWHVVSLSSLRPSTVCTAAEGIGSCTGTGRVHRCCHAVPRRTVTGPTPYTARSPTLTDATNAAQQASKGSMHYLPAHWATASLGTNNYVVTVGLGTPARYFTVELDIGSDLSWVQCSPCTRSRCYKQKDPLFNPSTSATYSTVPCGARECREIDDSQGRRRCSSGSSSSSRCPFEAVYADGSRIDGVLARDTLTLTTSPSDTIPGFVLGCGHNNSGFFGTEDGLIGLGRKSLSLSSQAASARSSSYGPSFSYCLPSLSSGAGYLALGGGASPANAQFTAMVPNHDWPAQYFVRLVGIKVAGELVKIPAASMMPPRRDLRRGVGGVFVFAGGATVELDFIGVMVGMGSDEPSVACLAFTSTGDDKPFGILGSQQQKTFAVVYDVANQRMGFGAKGCP
ncbi:hypothetical protein HU200_060163 [Digitaria exilis]|uniref:Peptidase A1 domain-containing protein n=1 Tax=Digitaria exilis TaxID=1010633 RepID=A0A835A708_9POAL|nr:hypothetical protein HU200_060163 [Digitaria exilis]